jgi:hypothetical protein
LGDFARPRDTVCRVGPALPATRVAGLVGGLALVAAFFMPWFAAQGLLLSGQFLHMFLSSAGPADVQRFMPGTTSAEVQELRLLVDLFPVLGAVAASIALLGSLPAVRGHFAVSGLLALSGFIPLLAWAIGRTRLPAGATSEVGLSVIAAGSLLVLVGGAAELLCRLRRDSSPHP